MSEQGILLMDLRELLSPLLLFALFILILKALKKRSSTSHEPPLPPSPWRLPLLGHIHHLVGKVTHRALRDLALKHGPIMLLKIGQVDVVAISSREGAEEVMKTQDVSFASRPNFAIGEFVLYGNSDILFSKGSYWRQVRKICTTELLSARRVKSFASVRKQQVFDLLRDISMTPQTVAINLSKKFAMMNRDIVSVAAVGKKFETDDDFLLVIKEILEAFAGFSFTDLFPSLKFVDVLVGTGSRFKKIRRVVDKITDDIIKQHQVKKAASQAAGDVEEDLVDVLLRIKDQGDLEIPLTFDNIKAVILDMFLAGTDTVSTTLEWAMTQLIRNPEVMKRARNEVREAVKDGTTLEESDVQGLNYLKLVIKETMRLHIPGPLVAPRVAKETCEVLGFKIPAGTRVIINAWALARDPKYWEDADSFKPERFDGSSFDFKGAKFEYLPFGAGRRMCPGIQFGMANAELALAQLLFYFDWELPHGMRPEDVDMTENFGSTASRKTDLYLLATPRRGLPSI